MITVFVGWEVGGATGGTFGPSCKKSSPFTFAADL